MDINLSVAFVAAKGSTMEKARLNCILQGTNPEHQVMQDFIQLQNEDGGFPFGMQKSNLSTINETTVALWWMEELNQLTSPAAKRAFGYLISTQRPDGSWEEDLRVAQYKLPPWIQLDDPKTRLYLSAYATYWLIVGGYKNHPALRKGIHFLIRNQDSSGKFYGYLHTTWIASGIFLLLGDRYEQIANNGIQALANRTFDKWDDSQIAWASDCLSKGGLSIDHPFMKGCLEELSERQKSDGSWSSEDGEAFAVGTTIQVLKVFKRFNMITGVGVSNQQGQ